jgi:hypothetical protein
MGLALAITTAIQAEDAPQTGARPASDSPSAEPEFGRLRTGQSLYDWNWLADRYDQNDDGVVSPEEFTVSEIIFTRLDHNWDNRLTIDDFDWHADGPLSQQKETTFALFKSSDTNSDGRITAEEWLNAFQATAIDGVLNNETLEELIYLPLAKRNQSMQRMRAGGRKLGYDSNKPAPQPGDLAPDFELQSPDGLMTFRLHSLRHKKPVVLIFGSFT